ncbi:hypothetical protein EVAR_24301_1 [Eumeta japonica]|uniref:Uncharacterized protein n=1 Tax=Eumeta variegata TaxID=151549 RepID=A0A4C1VL85_EUMVA|nr:hypothetical protein EVAR_24301_1 [Eumeta japonica]
MLTTNMLTTNMLTTNMLTTNMLTTDMLTIFIAVYLFTNCMEIDTTLGVSGDTSTVDDSSATQTNEGNDIPENISSNNEDNPNNTPECSSASNEASENYEEYVATSNNNAKINDDNWIVKPMSPLRNSSDCISQAAPTNQNNFVSKSITPGETNAGTSGSLACEQAIRERWTSLTNINYNNSLTLPNSTSERYSSDPILLLENELITLAMCDDELPPPFVPNEPWPGVNVLTHQSNHDNEKHKNQNGADEHGHNQNSNHQEDLLLLWELPKTKVKLASASLEFENRTKTIATSLSGQQAIAYASSEARPVDGVILFRAHDTAYMSTARVQQRKHSF